MARGKVRARVARRDRLLRAARRLRQRQRGPAARRLAASAKATMAACRRGTWRREAAWPASARPSGRCARAVPTLLASVCLACPAGERVPYLPCRPPSHPTSDRAARRGSMMRSVSGRAFGLPPARPLTQPFTRSRCAGAQAAPGGRRAMALQGGGRRRRPPRRRARSAPPWGDSPRVFWSLEVRRYCMLWPLALWSWSSCPCTV